MHTTARLPNFFISFTRINITTASNNIIIGNIVNYSIGVIQFSFITKSTIIQSFIYCIVPFVIGDILKIICATSIGMKIKSNKSIEGVLN